MFSESLFRITAASALTLACAAPAAAQTQMPPIPNSADVADFDMTLSVKQTTSWTTDDIRHSGCGGVTLAFNGDGRQVIEMGVTKLRVVVARVKPAGMLITHIWPKRSTRTALAPFRVKGSITRRARMDSIVLFDDGTQCADGGTGITPEPDCGTRSGVHGRVALVPPVQRSRRGLGIQLRGVYMPGGGEDLANVLFEHCMIAGPEALIEAPAQVISAKKLFGKGKRLIAKHEHKEIQHAGGDRSETTLKWRIVLDRRASGRAAKKR